jgi:hypothetical protein
MLSNNTQPTAPLFLQKLDGYFRDKRTTADYIYSSKIKFISKYMDNM